MSKRSCYNCNKPIPPETEHFDFNNKAYCTECVDATPYTAYMYYVDGEFMGLSEDDNYRHIEAEDDYEE